MSKIFISYRRADSRKDAGRIYDRLEREFGKENIFKDIDSIKPGKNFPSELRKAVVQCNVQLVIIGQQWLTVKDNQGNYRLQNSDDYVRMEIEAALQRDDCVVIPILVDNAFMPAADDLPPNLHQLALVQAMVVRDDPDFHRDVDKVIKELTNHLKDASIKTNESLETKPSPFPVTKSVQKPHKNQTTVSAKSVNTNPKLELEQLNELTKQILPEPFEWLFIPSGDVSPEQNKNDPDIDEFLMSKFPVTNAQYQVFLDESGYENREYWMDDGWVFKEENEWKRPSDWRKNSKLLHPVTGVSYFEASAFCSWLSSKINKSVVIPRDVEWKRSAQGDTNYKFPWGSSFISKYCNYDNKIYSGKNQQTTLPVTKYLGKAESPFGVVDLIGNVWEWCSTPGKSKPRPLVRPFQSGSYSNSSYHPVLQTYIIRGGSWDTMHGEELTIDYSEEEDADVRRNDLGFRISLRL